MIWDLARKCAYLLVVLTDGKRTWWKVTISWIVANAVVRPWVRYGTRKAKRIIEERDATNITT